MNKVEKIREEIKKRYEYWKEKESNSHSIESESRMSECNHLLSMIISLSDTEKDFGIKESVIPFGASDSELMEATYFIPQGYHAVIESNKVIIKKGEDPVSSDLEKEIQQYYNEMDGDCRYMQTARHFARWQKGNLWKDAQGDDLPEIDRDVIVLVKALPEHEDSLLKVSFAHRPPKYWMGKSISTGEITRYEPMRYDKGQWSKPAVVWWLDIELPKEEE